MTVKVVEVLVTDILVELLKVIFCDGSFWMTGELDKRLGKISIAGEHQLFVMLFATLFLKPEKPHICSQSIISCQVILLQSEPFSLSFFAP
jgi:hypothetical protein